MVLQPFLIQEQSFFLLQTTLSGMMVFLKVTRCQKGVKSFQELYCAGICFPGQRLFNLQCAFLSMRRHFLIGVNSRKASRKSPLLWKLQGYTVVYPYTLFMWDFLIFFFLVKVAFMTFIMHVHLARPLNVKLIYVKTVGGIALYCELNGYSFREYNLAIIGFVFFSWGLLFKVKNKGVYSYMCHCS